jgi:hypothetical protein
MNGPVMRTLWFKSDQAMELKRGGMALGFSEAMQGYIPIGDIPVSWLLSVNDKGIGVLVQEQKIDRNQTYHWIELDDELLCIEKETSIFVGKAVSGGAGTCASVTLIKSGRARSLLTINGAAGEGEKVLEECKAYFRRIARFVGAMPQKEDI